MRFNITPKLFRYITVKKQMWSLHLFLPPWLAQWWCMRRCNSVEAGVMGVASVVSVQDELICVRLVMPHCMFGMQLFLSEIVKFRFDQNKASCTNVLCRLGVFRYILSLFTVCFSRFSPGRLDGNLALSWTKLNCENVPFTNTRINMFTTTFRHNTVPGTVFSSMQLHIPFVKLCLFNHFSLISVLLP